MAENFSILMPTGLVMDVGVIAPVNGTGNYGASIVSPVMPGIRVYGTGEFPVTRLSGLRGTMRVSLVTGTAGGTGQAVAAISVTGTSLFLGLMLNTSNKPVVIIRDQYGAAIAESEPLVGSAIAAGTPIEVVFSWDSTGVVDQGLRAGALITMNTLSGVPGWTIAPTTAWATFVPNVLYVGLPPTGFSLVPFTGSIEVVQVSDEVGLVIPASASITEDLGGYSLMSGGSTMLAEVSWIGGAAAVVAGESTMTAAATVVYAGEAAMDGDSTVAAVAAADYEGEAAMDGDSVVTADGTVTP